MEQQANLLECIAFNSQLRFQIISDVQDYSWFTQNEMLINDLVAKLINYISRILINYDAIVWPFIKCLSPLHDL